MHLMKTFLATLILSFSATLASAVEFDYTFKDSGCSDVRHKEFTDTMKEYQGKLHEVVKGRVDVATFHKSWGKVVGQKYNGEMDDKVDVIFVFKSYPSAGIIFSYKDGCLFGAKVFPLDVLNKILEVYTERKRGI